MVKWRELRWLRSVCIVAGVDHLPARFDAAATGNTATAQWHGGSSERVLCITARSCPTTAF